MLRHNMHEDRVDAQEKQPVYVNSYIVMILGLRGNQGRQVEAEIKRKEKSFECIPVLLVFGVPVSEADTLWCLVQFFQFDV